jgi:hypothetical protein
MMTAREGALKKVLLFFFATGLLLGMNLLPVYAEAANPGVDTGL